MLKSSLIVYKIKFHENKLKEIAKRKDWDINFSDPIKLKEMAYHKFIIGCLERQEKARIDSLPWANAGQILHKEYKRDWTEEELKEFRQDDYDQT